MPDSSEALIMIASAKTTYLWVVGQRIKFIFYVLDDIFQLDAIIIQYFYNRKIGTKQLF